MKEVFGKYIGKGHMSSFHPLFSLSLSYPLFFTTEEWGDLLLLGFLYPKYDPVIRHEECPQLCCGSFVL